MLYPDLYDAPAGQSAREGLRHRPWIPLLLIACTIFFIAACLLTAVTKLPYVDEGTFGGSAINILKTGFSGNPSTPPWGLGIPLDQSTRYNFWVMPAYLYTLAAWFRVAPHSILSGRVLSIIFGVAGLFLLYRFVRLLGGSRALAALSFVLLATDFNMILRSSISRMDSMSLMLNFAAWVAYLSLRRRRLSLALFFGGALSALSFVTHPNGIIAFAGLAILAALLDRDRIRISSAAAFVAGAAIPAAIAASLILQAPAVWAEQVRAHAVHRFAAFEHPFTSIWQEFLNRYYWPFGGVGFGSPIDSRFSYARMILLLVLAAYSAAIVYAFFRRSLLTTASLAIFFFTASYFTFFETGKLVLYNIQFLPFFCLFLAAAAVRLFAIRKTLAAAVIGLVFLINLGSVLMYARSDHYKSSYLPAVNLLRSRMGPNDVVLTHAYFGFDLGFDRVVEDFTLADIVRRHPRFVTIDHWFKIPPDTKIYPLGPDPESAGMISRQERTEAVSQLQTGYHIVLTTPDYTIYEKTRP